MADSLVPKPFVYDTKDGKSIKMLGLANKTGFNVYKMSYTFAKEILANIQGITDFVSSIEMKTTTK